MSDAMVMAPTARQIWAAPGSSHDRLIGGLRIVLPMLIGMLAAFVVFDKKKVEVAKERMRTQAATYRGEDGKGQPFVMTAGSAVQKSSTEPIVRVDALAAQIQLKDGPANVTAPHGAYDMQTEQVHINGPVKVVASGGYTLDTNDATLDLKTRHLHSDGAVTGTVPQGQFSANQLSADLDNHVVTLDGNARLRIVPRKTR
jgi:lipopolysaccharide export system protein LptC